LRVGLVSILPARRVTEPSLGQLDPKGISEHVAKIGKDLIEG
jgi:hypothetical protein